MLVDWLVLGLAATGSIALASVGTRLALCYARRRALIDEPGRRRSHVIPTPRGGGLGVVLALLVVLAWVLSRGDLPMNQALAFGIGMFAVAVIGWVDDHRPLSARVRLVVHVVAAMVFVSQLPVSGDLGLLRWVVFGAQVLALVTAINFWNFMDGIDGLVATQTIWVGSCLAIVFAATGLGAWALLAIALAGASLGFLPFNFPRARIFLGDVGSGGIGFAVGGLLLQAQATGAMSVWNAGLIVSALALDATLTLLGRMLRGRRWYTAHREHLYQWLVRRGRGHPQVVLLYLAWNLILVLPLLWLSQTRPAWAPMLSLAALLSGAVLWWQVKRSLLLRQARRGGAT